MNKPREAKELLIQPTVVFSEIDEIRGEQHFFETFETDKVKTLNNPHHWLLRHLLNYLLFNIHFVPN